MFITARQLEQMLHERGKIVLPIGARLTPAAADFVRAKAIDITFGNGMPRDGTATATNAIALRLSGSAKPYLWWCGASSGIAKAALQMSARDGNLAPSPVASDVANVVAATFHLIDKVRDGSAAGGVIVVEHAGLAVTLSNRSPSLRAIVGTSLAAVDAGIRDVAANVLIVEPSALPLTAMTNMILRFVRAPRPPSDALTRALAEVAKR